MNTDTIKDFLNSFFENFLYKVRESFVFNMIAERYENLDSHLQKWLKIALWTGGLALIFAFPFSFFISSVKSIEDFKEKKSLILSLLKTKNTLSTEHQGFSKIQFEEKISSIVDQLVLSSDQEVKISTLSRTPFLPKALKPLSYAAKEIQIKGLNIKEAIEIGESLSRISPYTRILGFKVKEMEDKKNYFHTIFTLVSFFNSKPAPQITPLTKKPK